MYHALREKCPNTELFLVRISLYWNWIRRFTCRIIFSVHKDCFHFWIRSVFSCILTKYEDLRSNTEIYGAIFVFSPNAGKYGSEISSYLDTFHEVMKLSIVTSVQKKGNWSETGNHRLFSILPKILKFFERCVIQDVSIFSRNNV